MALIKTGNFTGTVGSQDSSRYQMHMYWEQHSIDGNYTQTKVIAKMYFWSKWEWHSTVFADKSHIIINGNLARPSGDVNVAGTGERIVMTHTVTITHSTAINIGISGRCDIHKSYYEEGKPYWYGVEGSATISLSAPPAKPIPTIPSNIQPTSGNYESGQKVTISWNKSTISSGSVTYHRVYINGVNVANVNGDTSSYIWYIPSADAVGTKYTASVDALSNLSVVSTKGVATGPFYKIASVPTTPQNIKPDSGEYANDIALTWSESTVNNSSITKYNVYINNSLINSTESTSLTWHVPDNDLTGTSYALSVEAVSTHNKVSNRGYASGFFYKAETNTPPNIPTLSIINPLIQGKYLAESTLDVELSQVIDPDGDIVRYALYGEYLTPNSVSWESLGDTNKCFLWSTSSRNKSLSIKNHVRGTQYRIWGKATDDKASSDYTSTISNIYRNQLPNKITSILPSACTFYTDYISINWNEVNDPDNQNVNYKVQLIKNNSNLGTIRDLSSQTSFNYIVPESDSPGTTYNFNIIPNDGMVDGIGTLSPTYIKGNTAPTLPKDIKPNSGYYKNSINISWTPSFDNENGKIYYNVYINNKKINTGEIYSTSILWSIPAADSYKTSYLVGVEAVDNYGSSSGVNYSEGCFYKADMMDKEMNISINDTNVIHTINGKQYFDKIHLNYWYENQEVNLLYNIQFAVADKSFQGDVSSLTWQNAINNNISKNTYIHSIAGFTDSTQKIIYRVKGIDGYGESSKWGYSDFCNFYIRDNTEKKCNIIYPMNNSILYTKNPKLCIEYNPINLYNYWLSLTINGKEYDDILKNESGRLVLDCPQDLIMGENTIKICEKSKLNELNTYVGPSSIVNIKVVDGNINLVDYIYANDFIKIYSNICDYKKAYGITNNETISIIKNKTYVSLNILDTLKTALLDLINKINNFYTPNNTVKYYWGKYYINKTNGLKGDYLETIATLSSSDYPSNGEKNGYWYISIPKPNANEYKNIEIEWIKLENKKFIYKNIIQQIIDKIKKI